MKKKPHEGTRSKIYPLMPSISFKLLIILNLTSTFLCSATHTPLNQQSTAKRLLYEKTTKTDYTIIIILLVFCFCFIVLRCHALSTGYCRSEVVRDASGNPRYKWVTRSTGSGRSRRTRRVRVKVTRPVGPQACAYFKEQVFCCCCGPKKRKPIKRRPTRPVPPPRPVPTPGQRNTVATPSLPNN